MFTLVPSSFFNPEKARAILGEVCQVEENHSVKYLSVTDYDTVVVYSDDCGSGISGTHMASILRKLPECTPYNKILCSISGDFLYLAIAQGKSLLLANCYAAPDFTTAEYYLFLAIKSLQINPEMSTVCWTSELSSQQEMSLYRYFKSVIRMEL